MSFLLALLTLSLSAQSIKVYSEFRRVDPKGAVIAADQGGKPREILSPGLMRNTYHSMRILVEPPPNKWYTLQIQQNPEALGITVYRELPASPESPIRDVLQKVKLPVQGKSAEIETYWLDLYIPPNALVRRVRVEAQLHDGTRWYIYPMEVRVLRGIAPQIKRTGMNLPPVDASTDTAARATLREYVCEDKPKLAPGVVNVRGLIRRNAQQDVAIARALQLQWGRAKLTEAIVQAAGGDTVDNWCTQPPSASPYGPEWYLRVRDFLYRESSR